MKRVYSASSPAFVGHIYNVLEQHGIPCILRNEFLIGGTGELPPGECLPEVWVVDDDDLPRARQLVDAVINTPDLPAWRCRRCGETMEGQFAACWSCGDSAPPIVGS